MRVSVVIPSHNPDPERLGQVLAALQAQSLPVTDWELLVIDNASPNPDVFAGLNLAWHPRARVHHEAELGLTAARLAGIRASAGDLIVFVDDDNLLAPDYLAVAVQFVIEHPEVGAAGGRSLPVYAVQPPAWFDELGIPLGCRDLGPELLIEAPPPDRRIRRYPAAAPIGAGLVLRRAVATEYAETLAAVTPGDAITDRRGGRLSSGGDCEIVLVALKAGWAVAYVPGLRLSHLIPASRLQPEYLARLARESNASWVQLLERYALNPWKAIPAWTVPLRRARAYLRCRAWQGPAQRIRWQGACGRFEGQAALARGTAR